MIRTPPAVLRLPALLLLSSGLLLAGCDSDGSFTLVPEVESRAGFEGTLDGWTGAADELGTGAIWSVESSSEAAAVGSGSLALRLETLGGSGRVWIERSFQVTPGTSYQVTLRYQLGTRTGDGGPWNLVAGAGPGSSAPPLAVRDDTDPGTGASGLVWVERSHTLAVTAGTGTGDSAPVVVGVGIAATGEGARSFFIDELVVEMIRTD